MVTELLSRPGVVVNEADYGGSTPLFRAAQVGNVAAVEALLAHPATDPNAAATEVQGRSPLHIAAMRNRAGVVAALLEHPGIRVNAETTYFRETPLHTALANMHAGVAQLLVAAGGVAYDRYG